MSAGGRIASQAEESAHEKTPDLQSIACYCDTLQNRGMEAAGIEPASREDSMKASTCVVTDLYFAAQDVQCRTSCAARQELF